MMRRATAATLGVLFAAGLCVSSAQAAYDVTVEQVGPDVVATGSGTLDLAAFPFFSSIGFSSAGIGTLSVRSLVLIGQTASFDDYYSGDPNAVTGPSYFGTIGTGANATSGTGSFVGFRAPFSDLTGGSEVDVPNGYVSGDPLGVSTATWDGSTIASLGLIPGVYTWTWGSGATADSFTMTISASVPEPGTWLLLGCGLLGLTALRGRASRRASV